MGKTQRRVDTSGIVNAGKAAGSPGRGDVAAGAGSDECDEQVLPRDAAGYIHDMAIELKDMAETARFSFLAYLLDLVIEESAMQKRGRL